MKYTERKKTRIQKNIQPSNRFTLHLIRGAVVLFVVGVVTSGIYSVTRLPQLTISSISVSGGETISHELIKERILQNLSGSYVFLVPKRFALTYPHEAMLANVSSVPRIHNVQINHDSRTTLSVSFDEYLPHALVCESPEVFPKCFFVDEIGHAFSEAPPLKGGALVRHIMQPREGYTIEEGINTDTLHAVDRFIARTEEILALRITEVEYAHNDDITFRISGGGALYATNNKDLDVQFERLTSLLGSEEFSHIEPGNFNYIDLRFDTKIFVHEEMGTTTASSTTLLE